MVQACRTLWGKVQIAFNVKYKPSSLLKTGSGNRPFPSSKKSHFQNEAKCETFVEKMSFICIIIKNHFHINGFALSLALKARFFGTRKWPIHMFKFFTDWIFPNTLELFRIVSSILFFFACHLGGRGGGVGGGGNVTNRTLKISYFSSGLQSRAILKKIK